MGRIACITDKIGRVQHKRMCFLSQFLPHIDVYTLNDYKNIKWNRYMLVYYSNYSLLNRVPCDKKKICSITSHKSLIKFKKTIRVLRNFIGVSVNNSLLLASFKKYIPKIYYTPNGVNTNLFCPNGKNSTKFPFKIGWVGNKDRSTKNYNFLRILRKIPEVEFSIIATSKKDVFLPNTLNKMSEYYRSLNFFLITSSTEGTPNPGLEALACGVPVITTRVGNMVDIIKDGYNGFFANDNVESLREAIKKARELSLEKEHEMAKHARDSVKEWDWDVKKNNWINFFEEFVSG